MYSTDQFGYKNQTGLMITMTDQEKLDLLEDFTAAWGRADLDGLLALMTADCVYAASIGPEPGKTYRGRAEVRQGLAEIIEFESGGEQRSGKKWISGDYVFSEWSYDDIAEDGTVTDIRGIDIFHFVDGKLALKDAYRKTKM